MGYADDPSWCPSGSCFECSGDTGTCSSTRSQLRNDIAASGRRAKHRAWWIPIAERSDQAEESGAETLSGYRSLYARVRIQCGRDCRTSIEGRDLTVRKTMSAFKHEILAKLHRST